MKAMVPVLNSTAGYGLLFDAGCAMMFKDNSEGSFVELEAAKQIDYILIDPECQVSRNKYSYINVFTPGTDSRTSDNYLYQNRKFNGTFAIDELMKDGCIIHTAE